MDPASCLLFLFFLFCSAYCACSETAYTAVSRVRLRTLAEKGNVRAKRALWICDRYDKTLTTISSEYVVYGTLLTTVIVYLFAEMIPKSFGKARSEELALILSGSMAFFVRLLTPISAIFTAIGNGISRLFGTPEDTDAMTEEDLQTILETIEGEGVLDPEKQALMNSAMEFGHKTAKDVMTPISQVVSISSSMSNDQLAAYIRTLPHSRLPVYEGHKNNIVGILPVNEFLRNYVSGKPVMLRKILLKPYIFDQNVETNELLQRMRLNKLQMVFICDENRNKLGIITMEDLLEELVGDIQDESDAGEGLQLR